MYGIVSKTIDTERQGLKFNNDNLVCSILNN